MPDYKEIELRSEEVQEILTRIPHWMIRWGNLVILALLLSLFLVSWVVKYPDIIKTDIIVTTTLPPEKLVANSSGRLEKILIADRQKIKKNTPLAVIENTANYKDVFLLKTYIDSVKINANGFLFPFENLPPLQLGNIETAFALLEKEYLNYIQYKDLKPYSIDGNAQQYESKQLKERLQLLIEQKEIGQTELNLKKKELERFKLLHQKGVISAQEWETKNIDYLQQEKNIRNLSSQISQTRSSINDLNKNSQNTQVNKSKDDINLYRNTIQAFNQLKKSISDWEQAYVLRSTITGEVTFLQVWSENQFVNVGDNVFSIIPTTYKNFVGKVKAPAQNSGKLKIGQEVQIRLANYPDREFGIINGKVKSISLIPDKEGNLLLDISLPDGLQTSYQKQINFQQEMSGTADIITEDLRLIERLLYQFRDVFRR
ncbi:HlyD family secretion protein [Flavobacterium sp.]|jgi:multidrug efflux pump subunit AcrA (membrane-fusion protein)|uniref:HlyD family secretion protein n=1 Tax=Flavobacterium sp. TaxID=239 RepID=UPI0037BE24B9